MMGDPGYGYPGGGYPYPGGYPGGYPSPGAGGGGVDMGPPEAQGHIEKGNNKKPNPLLKTLEEKVMPEKKDTHDTVAGLLYFPMEKQKLKDLQLIFTTSEGKISLRFKENK
jgi:hypothetical protein